MTPTVMVPFLGSFFSGKHTFFGCFFDQLGSTIGWLNGDELGLVPLFTGSQEPSKLIHAGN
ncbi:MAG: hypothetical protein Q8P67_11570 [archaeon]|nr:hypothetical protein [archaeon]